MKPNLRAMKMCTAATAIAVTALVAAACTQQSGGGSTSALTPLAPTVVGNVSSQSASTARGANTEVVCHGRGNGTFAPLSVNRSAFAAHLAHGDGLPLGEVPESPAVF